LKDDFYQLSVETDNYKSNKYFLALLNVHEINTNV